MWEQKCRAGRDTNNCARYEIGSLSNIPLGEYSLRMMRNIITYDKKVDIKLLHSTIFRLFSICLSPVANIKRNIKNKLYAKHKYL